MTEHAQSTLEGFAAAREGAQRAIDHADKKSPHWSEQARGFMAGFILQVPHFTSEQVWIAAEKAGIPQPPDRRAWGGVIQGFMKRGLIRKLGVGFSTLKRLHGNHIAVYERV